MANAITEAFEEAERRYSDAFERVRGLVPHDVWEELDDAHGALLAAHEGQVLANLVIAVDHRGTFPRFGSAVSTAGAQPVDVDECNHRSIIATGEVLAGTGETEWTRGAFGAIARAELEDDLGNPDEAERLRDEARRAVPA